MNPSFESHAAVFAALGQPIRLAIFRWLGLAGPDGRIVGEIQGRFGIPASTLSHHLDVLRTAGLLTQERQGRQLRYRAVPEALTAACRGKDAAEDSIFIESDRSGGPGVPSAPSRDDGWRSW